MQLEGRPKIATGQPVEAGCQVLAGLRPEHLSVVHAGEGGFELPVTMIESTGSLTYIVLGANPELTLVEQGRERVRPGDRLRVEIRPELVHLFDPTSGKRI